MRFYFNVSRLFVRNKNASSTSIDNDRSLCNNSKNLTTYLSVAIFSLAIEMRSSVLVAADRLVTGVLIALPPLTDPDGVLDDVDGSVPFFTFTDCFAAFSASLFCLDAEGAIMKDGRRWWLEGKKC